MSTPTEPPDGQPDEPRVSFSRAGAPAPLEVAASLVFVQGLLTVLYGVAEAFHTQSDRAVMGLTTSLFLVVYGAGLGLCAWGLHHMRTWARGPSLLAQLIWLGLAWNFRGGDTSVVAVLLAVPAVIVLAGMLHPRSIAALEGSTPDQ